MDPWHTFLEATDHRYSICSKDMMMIYIYHQKNYKCKYVWSSLYLSAWKWAFATRKFSLYHHHHQLSTFSAVSPLMKKFLVFLSHFQSLLLANKISLEWLILYLFITEVDFSVNLLFKLGKYRLINAESSVHDLHGKIYHQSIFFINLVISWNDCATEVSKLFLPSDNSWNDCLLV